MKIPGTRWLLPRLMGRPTALARRDQTDPRTGSPFQMIPLSDLTARGRSVWSDAIAPQGALPFADDVPAFAVTRFGEDAAGYLPWAALPAMQWPMVVADENGGPTGKGFRSPMDGGAFSDALDPESGWGGRHVGFLPDERAWILAATLRA